MCLDILRWVSTLLILIAFEVLLVSLGFRGLMVPNAVFVLHVPLVLEESPEN